MHARVTKTERDPRGHTHELQDFHKERDTRAGRVAASYTLPTRLSEEIAARLHSTHSFVGEALPFQNSPGPPSCVLSITRAKTRQGTPGHTWAHLGTRKLSKAYSSRRGRGDTLIHTTHWNMEVPEEVMWPCHATLEVSQNSRPSMYERSRSCVHSAFECRPSVTLLHTPTVRGMFRRQTRGNAAVWSVEQSPSDRGDLGFEVTTRERRGSPQPVCVAAPLWPGINTFYARIAHVCERRLEHPQVHGVASAATPIPWHFFLWSAPPCLSLLSIHSTGLTGWSSSTRTSRSCRCRLTPRATFRSVWRTTTLEDHSLRSFGQTQP